MSVVGAGRKIASTIRRIVSKRQAWDDKREMELEERTRQLCAEIEEMRRIEHELIAARDRADAANIAKSRFLAAMSHDLRTPLNAIVGFSELLIHNPNETLTPAQRTAVEQIIRGSHHLLALINDILDLARVESGTVNPALECVALTDVLLECAELTEPAAAHKDITIIHDWADAMPSVKVDRTHLKQALLNLLSNAVKYNRVSGTLALRCPPAYGDTVRIEVEDSGPGIPNRLRDRLFAPFDRLGMEGSGVEGTGIGLMVTKQLVERMGGTIGFVSAPDVGTTFWLALPIAECRGAGRPNGQLSRTPSAA